MPVLIVNFWERDAIRQQQLPCRSLLHSSAERKRVREPCPSTSASKVAQRQVMLMCCNTVAISPAAGRSPNTWVLQKSPPQTFRMHPIRLPWVSSGNSAEALGGGAAQLLHGSPPSLCGCSMLEKVGVLWSKHPSATDATSMLVSLCPPV